MSFGIFNSLLVGVVILHVASGQDLDGCGVSKGCFKQPSTCGGDDCEVYVTWETTSEGQTQFAMRAERAAGLDWVAFGLRPSATTSGMAPADVYACTNQMEVKRSKNVFNPSYNSEAMDTPNATLSVESITFENNVINCVFTRQASLEGDATFYNISGDNEYYILLALGDAINGDGTIAGHYHTSRYYTDQPMMLQGSFDGPSTTPSMTVPPGQELEGCDETKGCFVQPEGCGGNDCTAYVTWQLQEDGQTRFTMRAQRQEGLDWVAFGLRPSATTSGMVPADVYACTSNSEVRRSENVSPFNSVSRDIPSGSVETVSASSENNVINCVFLRQPDLPGDATFYNISGDNEYYILLAIGNAINTDGSIEGHRHVNRWASGSPQALAKFGPVTTKSMALPKAHGSLMLIAWAGLASIGITMARYYKKMWPNSTLLGEKVWFTIHRMCMVTCVLCFCAGFAVIFVHVGGFVQGTYAIVHAVCGICATALGIINPIMALCRPHPETPNRPYFNWAHWGVGTCALMLAWVSILLGVGYNESSLIAGTTNAPFYVMISLLAYHMFLWLQLQIGRCRNGSEGNSDNMAMGSKGESNEQLDTPSSTDPPAGVSESSSLLKAPAEGSSCMKILMFFFVTVTISLVIVAVVAVCLGEDFSN